MIIVAKFIHATKDSRTLSGLKLIYIVSQDDLVSD